jgi:hypothetical protein
MDGRGALYSEGILVVLMAAWFFGRLARRDVPPVAETQGFIA